MFKFWYQLKISDIWIKYQYLITFFDINVLVTFQPIRMSQKNKNKNNFFWLPPKKSLNQWIQKRHRPIIAIFSNDPLILKMDRYASPLGLEIRNAHHLVNTSVPFLSIKLTGYTLFSIYVPHIIYSQHSKKIKAVLLLTLCKRTILTLKDSLNRSPQNRSNS